MPSPHPTDTTDRRRSRLLAVLALAALLLVPATLAWAGHQFSDVPDGNVFHDDIDWLANVGVTRGCNPPDNTRFCPDDSVTREQMAAFLHRLETEDVFTTPQDMDGLLPITTFLMFADGRLGPTSQRSPVTGAPTVEKAGDGSYLVTFPGYSYGLVQSRAVCSPIGNGDRGVVLASLSGRMWIRTHDSSDGTFVDSGVSCSLYG